MTKEEDIAHIEKELNIQIPASYEEFLVNKGSDIAFGLPILGLPATYDLSSVLGATLTLRILRPELINFIVIRMYEERVLCLDLINGSSKDAPLVEVFLYNSEPPATVHKSFNEYIKASVKSKVRIKEGLNRIKDLFDNNKKLTSYSHDDDSKRIPFKSRDWKIIRLCVHDFFTGLIAFRHNERINGIEVEVFLTTDHENYESGHGLKAALVLLFSEAHKNGSSLCLYFSKFKHNSNFRIDDFVPSSIKLLCDKAEITLSKQNEGIITHDEALSIFCYLLNIDETLINDLKKLNTDENFSLQGICFLVASRIWNIDQVKWIISNSPKPFHTLFGKISQEDFYNFDIAISYARALISVDFLCKKLENFQANDGESKIQSYGPLIKITCFQDSILDWGLNSQQFEINKDEALYVLPRPRYFIANFVDSIKEDILLLIGSSPKSAKKFILYPFEFSKLPAFNILIHETLKSLNTNSEINILLSPYSMNEIDEIVFSRFKRVKSVRK